MPHKKNPVRSERICGLARVVRAQVVPVMEGIPLWHERDISHSSTERVALPDAAIGTDFLLDETTGADHRPVGRRGPDAGEPGRDPRPDLHLGGAARAGRGRDVPGGRLRAGPGGGDGHAARPARRSGRRCAARAPSAASRWTRPGWTRPAARNATSSDSAACSSDWSGCRDRRRPARPDVASTRERYASSTRPPTACCCSSPRTGSPPSTTCWSPRSRTRGRSSPSCRCGGSRSWPGWRRTIWWTRPIPARFAGRAMACRRLSMIPVECVARGYLTGSALADYRRTGTVCGIRLPPGLADGSRLPAASLHPGHQGAPRRARREHPGVRRDGSGGRGRRRGARADHAGGVPPRRRARRAARHHRGRHQDRVRHSTPMARCVLADEVLTPDSSRFWPATSGSPGAASRRSTSSTFATGSPRRSPAGTAAASRRRRCPEVVERTRDPLRPGLREHHRAALGVGRHRPAGVL